MKTLFKTISLLLCGLAFLANAIFALALRSGVEDWYIDNFKSDITVQQDGSLDIVEDITADCGTCSDKHGIFRVLPYEITTREGNTFETPIRLKSITDELGNSYTYRQNIDTTNKTVTWKVGDPNITVQGVHHYRIRYAITNAIRDQTDAQELYWNTVGAFWDLQIDHAYITLHLPAGNSKETTPLSLYAGPTGSSTATTTSEWVSSSWTDPRTLVLTSNQIMSYGDDITVSLAFPANTFTLPSQEVIAQELSAMTATSSSDSISFTEFLPWSGPLAVISWVVLPMLAFFLCFRYWEKEGKDPLLQKTVIPEYDPPYNLPPLLLGAIQSYGSLKSGDITAELIDLAVNDIITIEEIPKQGFFGSVDYRFTKLPVESRTRTLSSAEEVFLNNILTYKDTALFSAVKLEFGKNLTLVQKAAEDDLVNLGFIDKGKGKSSAGVGLGFIGFALIMFGVIGVTLGSVLGIGLMIGGLIAIIFATLMPRRSAKGADLLWKTKGFRLFMDTAEKYRQQFFEKEGSFEKLLPYAILFGMTKEWLKKMKELGVIPPEGLHIHNVALASGTLLTSDTFDNMVSGISSGIHSANTSSSGSGGGGFSGGGGGGGGGGGW